MFFFHLYKAHIFNLALMVCFTGLSVCQASNAATESTSQTTGIYPTGIHSSDANSIYTTVVTDEKLDPNEIADNTLKNPDRLDEKKIDLTDPNAPGAEDPNDPENDIFEITPSTLVLINEVYDRIFTPELITEDGLVKYSTLRRKYRRDVLAAHRALKKLNPAILMTLPKEERIAFWINTYNFCTIRVILDNYPIQRKWWNIQYPGNSIMQITGAWTKKYFDIQREEYTLQEIEQEFLLKRYRDPRICFALSNASVGGATLRNEPYKADRLDEQLDDQVGKYIAKPKGVRLNKDNDVLYLSNVFQAHVTTFLESKNWASIKKFRTRDDEERIWLNFILPHLSEEDIRYLETEEFKVKFIEVDWHLNEAE